jgi:hypothetical protein
LDWRTYLVDVGFDVLHLVEIFHCALFASREDQPLLVNAQWNLGLGG